MMNPQLRQMLCGMAKTAIATACGVITGMPAVDPEHFNISTSIGWEHMGGLILWLVIVAECRYIEDWFGRSKQQ